MYEYDEGEPYVPPTPKRRATAGQDYTYTERRTEAHPQQHAPPRRNNYSLLWVGLGMLVCLALWMGITLIVLPWWHGLQVQWHYGDNRVSVFGADVGHGGVSRFIAFEDGEEIVIVEAVAKKYTVYTIPVTAAPGQLVTLSVSDVNNDGKHDLIVHIDGQEGAFALINTGDVFSWSH